MMSARSQARPTRTLPIHSDRKSFKLERGIDGNDAVDLAVRVLVVLSCVLFLGVEVHTCQRHVKVVGDWELYLSCQL